jgi:hypothetical protein
LLSANFPGVIQLLSQHRVKAITFPLHTSGIFHIFGLVFFDGFKRVKKYLAKNLSRRRPKIMQYGCSELAHLLE